MSVASARFFHRSRQLFLALVASLALSPVAAHAAVTWGGVMSGLPWASGSGAGGDELADLRGRPLDVRTGYLPMTNWAAMIQSAPAVHKLAAGGRKAVVALGMIPETNRGQLSQCAAGQFDSYIRQIGVKLISGGGGNAALRLGWEANRMGGFPWAVQGDGSSWKACYRHWVSVLRSLPGQNFVMVWNMGQKGTFPLHIDNMYPGSDVVDVVGTQFYDRCGSDRSLYDWNDKLDRKQPNGSPWGIATWLAYAKGKGKRLAIPEWGIAGPRYICNDPGFDNPLFMQLFHGFLQTNASSIAFESYFNGNAGGSPSGGTHKIAPATWNPRAAAAYRSLW
ncbi:MAG: hypothetical protein U1E17_14300 [Geminicoccaceae bacterium]